MYFIFVISFIALILAFIVYILNERSIRSNLSKFDLLRNLKQKMLQFSPDNTFDSDLGIECNSLICIGGYILDKKLENIVWKMKKSNILFDPIILDPSIKHTIQTRAITGGGYIRVPWRQRVQQNRLQYLTACVFAVGDYIGITMICL